MAFVFDPDRLAALAADRHEEYVSARPFPHAVIDGLFPEPVLDDVLAEFPPPEGAAWLRFDTGNERKLASREDTALGEITRQVLAELNGAAFIDFLEQLTGIEGLVPDPHLEGGGLHQIVPGGHLNVHVDFNRHPRTGLARRLNALVYLNRDWKEEYEGALELWSTDGQRCERKILPLFNRLVVFSTTETSYHGHPTPLRCPEDQTRKSLALYYYSLAPGSRNGETAHNTMWAAPRGKESVKAFVRGVTPPVLLDLARGARRRGRSRA